MKPRGRLAGMELQRRNPSASARLLTKPALRPTLGKDKASDKKVQIKGKRGVKGKQADVADQ
jgi:high-mobility group nucleosome-binding domain-containing protein 1